MTSNHAGALGIWLCKSKQIKLKYILSRAQKTVIHIPKEMLPSPEKYTENIQMLLGRIKLILI